MKKGFSLVELSVVLIIIGILIAAVATSTKLIGNSKLRKVMQEVESMKSGINTFYASFDAYPGDFKRASDFFDGVPDGNGDNFVEYNPENPYAWLHLASAAVIDGSFSGEMSGSGEGATPRENSPGSQYSPGVCYNYIYNADLTGSTVDTAQNNITVGTSVTNKPCVASTFIPKDAEFIDAKLDDGNPVNGNIRAYGGSNSNGTTYSAECIVDNAYNNTDLDQECVIGILF
ncbi:MAG: prepilin-type N-terminal cleavage/methylation domain-containing protein [Rickettsiales bacterium]